MGPPEKALTLAADVWPPRHQGLEELPHQEAAAAAAVEAAG